MQFRDLGAQYRRLKAEIDQGIQGVIESSAFILGAPVGQLEKELAEFAGAKHCVTCANGTEALQLILMAWGVGAGDAVFTSDFTFAASAGAGALLGATAVFADIDPDTFNMCPASLEAAIVRVLEDGKLTPKAIIPVDLFGQPANYPKIQEIADKYGLKVLEDGAQGFGGAINGRRAGSFGDAATTSFFPAKPLGCYGDGGAMFTDDDGMDETLRSLRAQGRSPKDKYENVCVGLNSRLDTLQAAILLPKLRAFETFELDAVNRAAARYTERLAGAVKTPVVAEGFYSSWAQYTIMLENEARREHVRLSMKEKGIPSMVYYPRGMHRQTAYRGPLNPESAFPNTVAATQRVLSLPMYPDIDEDTVDMVCSALLNA